MPEIDETPLPGVGVRHEFITRAGERLGVVAHRSGRRELLVYSASDPDECREALALTTEEATVLSGLLRPGPVRRGDRPRQPLGRFVVDWIPVPVGSPYAGSSIAAAGIRTVTGVSVVAVLRGEAAFPSPGPDFTLQAGDLAVVVGTSEGIDALIELLET